MSAHKLDPLVPEVPIKRGPGRPPNKKNVVPVVRQGIQLEPKDSTDTSVLFEFVHENPIIYKKIFNLVNKTNASRLFIFSSDTYWGFQIVTCINSTITITIDATNAIYYYTREHIFKRLDIEQFKAFVNLIIAAQHEVYFKVDSDILSKKDILYAQSVDKLVGTVSTSKIPCIEAITAQEYTTTMQSVSNSISKSHDGLMSFQFTGDGLKSTLATITKPYTITITKGQDNQLTIEYDKQHTRYTDPKVINLVSAEGITNISARLNGQEILLFAEAIAETKGDAKNEKITFVVNECITSESVYSFDMYYSIRGISLYANLKSLTTS